MTSAVLNNFLTEKSNAIRHTFKAYERLKREQHIDTLFRIGKAFSFFPLKVIYLLTERGQYESSPVRVGFSIPKKKFRKAVIRNRLKRLMREAWRLNNRNLYEQIPADKQLHAFIIFTGVELPDFAIIEETIKKAIEKMLKQIAP